MIPNRLKEIYNGKMPRKCDTFEAIMIQVLEKT
jgi:hypothetical protein